MTLACSPAKCLCVRASCVRACMCTHVFHLLPLSHPTPLPPQVLHLESSPSLQLLQSCSLGVLPALERECQLERLTLDAAAVSANLSTLRSMQQLRCITISGGTASGADGSAEGAAVLRMLQEQLEAAPGPSSPGWGQGLVLLISFKRNGQLGQGC